MRVTAAGWPSERERRRRIVVRLEIGTYFREIEFTVFGGLQKAGYDLVLGKPWLRLHNRRHDIDHITNEMWIDAEDGRRHHLVGRQSEISLGTECTKFKLNHNYVEGGETVTTPLWRKSHVLYSKTIAGDSGG